jgi:hypothetical protein
VKTSKLVIGIVSIVLSLVMLFQSCAANVGSALNGGTDTSGSVGTLVAILMIVAGIVGIAARSSKGGAIAATIIYAIAGLSAIGASTGMYKDLLVWGILSLIFAVVFLISIFKQDYSKPSTPSNPTTPPTPQT